jgi:hypothetical protein
VSRNDPMRDSDYMLQGDARTRAIRRDSEDDENLQPVAYVPGSDKARAFPGDEKFPFVKDVPDVTGPIPYRQLDSLPVATSLADYQILEAVDVRGHRAFALFGSYFVSLDEQGAGSVLSLVVEAALTPLESTGSAAPVWFPIGVVDPTLNTPAIEPGFAYRNFFASEFRLDPWINITPPFIPPQEPRNFTLIFDVSWYRDLRVRCADLVAPSGLQLSYMRMR